LLEQSLVSSRRKESAGADSRTGPDVVPLARGKETRACTGKGVPFLGLSAPTVGTAGYHQPGADAPERENPQAPYLNLALLVKSRYNSKRMFAL